MTYETSCSTRLPTTTWRSRAHGFEPRRLGIAAERWTGRPSFHIAMMSRVAVISRVGSPPTRRRSALQPGAMRPRSFRWKILAGTDVAAARASVGERPASTRSSSAPCTLAPFQLPGAGESVTRPRPRGAARHQRPWRPGSPRQSKVWPPWPRATDSRPAAGPQAARARPRTLHPRSGPRFGRRSDSAASYASSFSRGKLRHRPLDAVDAMSVWPNRTSDPQASPEPGLSTRVWSETDGSGAEGYRNSR